ncbi:MAG: universal stress protein E [Oceanicoccus sp.]|jgi:universal stress protein E
MSQAEKIFVVVNPFDIQHTALQRAIFTAQIRAVKPILHVFVVVDTTDKKPDYFPDGNVSRKLSWFNEAIHNPILSKQIEYSIEVSWSSKWQRAIMASATEFQADIIFLPASRNTPYSRFNIGESKWSLLKESNVPVMLVRPGGKDVRKTVLAAINLQAESDEQKQLNKRIIERSMLAAERYGADLHVVNAYRETSRLPNMSSIIRETGLPSSNIHIEHGYTDEVIEQISKHVDADLVVMGTLGVNGRPYALRGNTAERVISVLDVDTMVINS